MGKSVQLEPHNRERVKKRSKQSQFCRVQEMCWRQEAEQRKQQLTARGEGDSTLDIYNIP